MELTKLNDCQLEAVKHIEGPLLILAGAGSGKTRVITYRIAYLIEQGVPEYRILALTFTNKAASEMRERIAQLVDSNNRVWVSTFHSFCVSILRKHIDRMGYSTSFTIYDDTDSLSIIKECFSELNLDLDGEEFNPKLAKYIISASKNDGISVRQYEKEHGQEDAAAVYACYEKKLKANNALDFNDLLLKTLELFRQNPDLQEEYSDRFQYIHVDEYQDTNATQYKLIKMLAKVHGNLCVVGDDDQSIYGWRGANIRNILDFEQDFAHTKVIRLEQNYRSTNNILEAANSVIANNLERKEKRLWTDAGAGDKIIYYRADTDRGEADFVVKTIQQGKREGMHYRDFAVLYRTNAQSRVIEECMMKHGIPYNVYGGFKFYSRKEVKDVIAYLTVMVNPDDDVAFRRIINTPKRGIGNTSVEVVSTYAARNQISLYDACMEVEETGLKPAAQNKIVGLMKLINTLITKASICPVGDFVKAVLDSTGLIAQYEEKQTEENISKIDNLYAFLDAAKEFEQLSEQVSIQDFLENIMLVTDMDTADEEEDKASLMTLHSAKGLEFPIVFMVGMENGLFPGYQSQVEEKRMEEERRLCYVGITRAREKLYLTNARSRMMFGHMDTHHPSVFLDEIPDTLLDIRKDDSIYLAKGDMPKAKKPAYIQHSVTAAPKPKQQAASFTVGQKVMHPKFGVGTIIQIDGSGDDRLVTIAFEGEGMKKLSTAFAPLTAL